MKTKKEPILDWIEEHGGYAQMKELKDASFHTRELARLVKEEKLEKVKAGLYRLIDLKDSGKMPQSFMDACRAVPHGIICLLSALDYYGFTTFNPSEVQIAIPHDRKSPKIQYPPVKFFFFRDRFYTAGRENIKTSHGLVRIYSKEKTICDVFRYRKTLGEDLALEGLRNYLQSKDRNLNLLQKYAEICQVKTILTPYLKALVNK